MNIFLQGGNLMKVFSKKILSGLSLTILTLFMSTITFASVGDVKNAAVDSIKKSIGYGLGYGVVNATPGTIVAGETVVPTVSSESLQNAEPVKTKKYTIHPTETNHHKSSMYITDQATNARICKVNVSFKAHKGLFDKKPEISKLKADIDGFSSKFNCTIKEKSEITQDGKEGAIVVVVVTPNISKPLESQPK